ncbi:DUF3418 domain-containing protein [Candidatus Albibeggiatoa sp. nov. BB20]
MSNYLLPTLLDFRWTLEELNVATFAQELKIPQPISISTN